MLRKLFFISILLSAFSSIFSNNTEEFDFFHPIGKEHSDTYIFASHFNRSIGVAGSTEQWFSQLNKYDKNVLGVIERHEQDLLREKKNLRKAVYCGRFLSTWPVWLVVGFSIKENLLFDKEIIMPTVFALAVSGLEYFCKELRGSDYHYSNINQALAHLKKLRALAIAQQN